jgi:predicted component of type VI protein secretion system
VLDAKLVIVGGADTALEYLLDLPTSIGRGQENDIPLAHPLVSRKHCELLEEAGRLIVRDLGSLNGTYVGNQPVEGSSFLAPGQLLTIGTVTFRAIYGEFNEADVLDAGFDDAINLGTSGGTTHGRDLDTDAGVTMVGHRRVSADPLGEAPDTLDTDTPRPTTGKTDRVPSRKPPKKR